MKLLLASRSATRSRMLEAAGVPFELCTASIDEEQTKAELRRQGADAKKLAMALAEAKALGVDASAGSLVLGADQTLERDDGSMLDKPSSREAAGDQLRALSGQSHRLHSAAALAEAGRIVWSETESVSLHVRPLSESFIAHYLDGEYDAIRHGVGGYRIEGPGVQLFDRIEGSHFAILGLPLLPLLGYLRERGVLPDLMTVPYAEVIGDPIAHSKSPLIHRFWLTRLGLEGDYRAVRVAAGELQDYFSERRTDPAWRGCNVTVPHKQAVASHLDRVDALAGQVGAVNLVFREGAMLVGGNSDVDGLCKALPPVEDGELRTACLIGSGGAALAALAAFRLLGITNVRLNVRNRRKGEDLLERFGLEGRVGAVDDAENLAVARLIVNASTLGMSGQDAMPASVLARVEALADDRTIVFDMVYAPLETALLGAARRRGLRTVDGLTMLVAQAASAFAAFYGVPAPREHDHELRRLLTS